MVVARKWVIVEPVEGTLKDSRAKLVQETLPDLADNEVLFEAVYLSVDSCLSPHALQLSVGDTVSGQQLARVVQSNNSQYPVGTMYLCEFGWRTHTIVNSDTADELVTSMPTGLGDLPPSYVLGIMGISGVTAYVGLIKEADTEAGETVLVNDAAGAVGSAVAQVARIMGCNVIVCGTTDSQVAWLKQIGFTHIINCQTENVAEKLKAADPAGVDVYFDQVGGESSVNIIKNHMKTGGRVVIAGNRSAHNPDEPSMGPHIFDDILLKQLTIKGFSTDPASELWEEALFNIMQWLNMGKLVYKEHVIEGFENLFPAACELASATNVGKTILKI